MVSSTTPRLGPRCPPLLERTVISRSRISAASCSSSGRESFRTRPGESIPSSILAIASAIREPGPLKFGLSPHPPEDSRTFAASPPASPEYRTCPILLFSHEVGRAFGQTPRPSAGVRLQAQITESLWIELEARVGLEPTNWQTWVVLLLMTVSLTRSRARARPESPLPPLPTHRSSAIANCRGTIVPPWG